MFPAHAVHESPPMLTSFPVHAVHELPLNSCPSGQIHEELSLFGIISLGHASHAVFPELGTISPVHASHAVFSEFGTISPGHD